ncbi:MAG TPA: TIGR00282 family metallophosphoesterase [Kiritimatiellia bacterium]
MRILHIGDIVGSPGRVAFGKIVPRLRDDEQIDFIVVNGENAAGGRGITPSICDELFTVGAHVITLGDHAWDQKEIFAHIAVEPRLIRPANFAPGCPGRGWVTVETPLGKVTVIALIGRVFLPPMDCPFRTVDAILKTGADFGKVILVEIHAEATSEKIAIGRYLDGRVSSVAGTHTHVQTSDEAILPNGTAYITELGMTGPKDSVLGRDLPSVLEKFITGLPSRFEVAKNDVALEGIILQVDEKTGKATKIKRIREKLTA